MTKWLVVTAGLYGFWGVGFGAFGAHALKEKLPPERLANVELAVRYLFFTIPGLLTVAWLASDCEGGLFEPIAGWSLGLGALLFSGSLLALALTGKRRWGAVTPIGGVLLLVGWASIAAAALVTTFGWPSGGMYLKAC